MSCNPSQWKAWYETDAPEDEPIPDGYDSWMSAFDRLLMIRCWCAHRTLHEAHKYVRECLGSELVDGAAALDLTSLALHESSCRCPLLALISTGSDPSSSVQAIAKKLKIGESESLAASVVISTQ